MAGELGIGVFNVHGGVDGWARPFDVAAALASVDTDVIVVPETFVPDEGPGPVLEFAEAAGYEVHLAPYGRARLLSSFAPSDAKRSWSPHPSPLRTPAVSLDDARRLRDRRRTSITRGTSSVAVLTRQPVIATTVVALPRLWRDPARRHGVCVDIDLGGAPVRVIGTHLGHLSHGSWIQMRALASIAAASSFPVVIAGDMNCWGPFVALALRPLRRGVTGRTWPASHPHSQIDHILISPDLEAHSGAVLGPLGSDHRAVRAVVVPRSERPLTPAAPRAISPVAS